MVVIYGYSFQNQWMLKQFFQVPNENIKLTTDQEAGKNQIRESSLFSWSTNIIASGQDLSNYSNKKICFEQKVCSGL